MSFKLSRSRLGSVRSYADLGILREELRPHNGPALFQDLFDAAAVYQADMASDFAACLLAELEPPCPLTCRDALIQLAAGSWNPSDRLVPFYLVSQFGKQELRRTIEALLAEAGACYVNPTFETVLYWIRLPAADLIAGHLEGRWREWRAASAEQVAAADRGRS